MTITKATMLRAAILIDHLKGFNVEWGNYLRAFYIPDEQIPSRLLQSQHFENDDYHSCISRLFANIYDANAENGENFAKYILRMELDISDQTIISRDPELFLELGLVDDTLAVFQARPDYLSIQIFPHDFYRELTAQINIAYRIKLFVAVEILSRKLIENIVIDILRKKYGTSQLALYYDVSRGRFQDFSILVQNLSDHLGDFLGFPSINPELIRKVNVFRETGNSSVHNLLLNSSQVSQRIEVNKTALGDITRILFATFSSLP